MLLWLVKKAPQLNYTCLLSTALLFSAGCSVDSKLDNETATESNVTIVEQTSQAVSQVLDATDDTQWVYYDLDTASVIYPTDSGSNNQWDIAFKRFKIKINGGYSGTGGVEVSAVTNTSFKDTNDALELDFLVDQPLSSLTDEQLLQLGSNPFFSVCTPNSDKADNYCLANGLVDRTDINGQETAYVFLTQGSGQSMSQDGSNDAAISGWYDYNQTNHVLTPSDDSWVILSSAGTKFRFQMLGFYGLPEINAEPGTIAFQFQSLDASMGIPLNGEQQLLLQVNADITVGTAPMVVNFTGTLNGAQGAAQWQWAFGDGASSMDNPHVQHTYVDPGNYTTTIAVSDERGVTVHQELQITVTDAAINPDPTTQTHHITALQDTYVYDFLGNQPTGATSGDSGGILVWNHESNHGAKALLSFGNTWLNHAILSGNYTATLYLYQYCAPSGFVSACAGDADPVRTDIILQTQGWSENDASLAWSDIAESPVEVLPLIQNTTTNDWVSVNITPLVNTWVLSGSDHFSIALSQEAYPVIRNAHGHITASSFCDTESSSGVCNSDDFRPYIILQATP